MFCFIHHRISRLYVKLIQICLKVCILDASNFENKSGEF